MASSSASADATAVTYLKGAPEALLAHANSRG
jgi:hypothetical protein